MVRHRRRHDPGRHSLSTRAGYALLSTLLALAAATALIAVVVAAWGTSHQSLRASRTVLRAQSQAAAAVAYGTWWLEQDPAAARLNTSTPTATLSVPPPDNTPAGTVALQLTDPVTTLTIAGPSAITIGQGVTWAFAATATDAAGHPASLNDLTLNWQAIPTGSSPGSLTAVAPGVFQATGAGQVNVTIPSVTTATGQTLAVTCNTITVTIANGAVSQPAGLQISPATVAPTLQATVPFTAVYTTASGTQTTVTAQWTSSSPAVTLSPTAWGVDATAAAVGSATLTATYTPSGGSPVSATATVTVGDPVRVVQVTPQGSPPAAAIAPVVQVQGSQATVRSWTAPTP